MRTGTPPLFPAVVDGAATLQAVLDARDGERLPLEMALYVGLEVSQQVARLHALGKGVGPLDPKAVWCQRDGGIFVPEGASANVREDLAATGRLVYWLLTGAEANLEEPPSAHNPLVDDELDAVVMASIGEPAKRPYSAHVLVETIGGVFEELDLTPSPEGMQRLVLAVPDPEPEALMPVTPPTAPLPPAQLAAAMERTPPAPPPPTRRAPRVAPEALESQLSEQFVVPRFEWPAWLRPMRVAVAGIGLAVVMLVALAWPSSPAREASSGDDGLVETAAKAAAAKSSEQWKLSAKPVEAPKATPVTKAPVKKVSKAKKPKTYARR